MPRPKTNEEILVQQNKDIDRANKQTERYNKQASRNRDRKQKYDSGSGHGVAVLFDEKPAESSEYNRALENERKRRASQLDDAENKRDKAKEDAKKSKDDMKEAKRRMVGDRIKDGKGIGLVLFNEKGEQSDINGKPVSIQDPRDGKKKKFNTKNGRIPNKEVWKNENKVRSDRSMAVDGKSTAGKVYPANPTPAQYGEYMKDTARSDIQGIDAPWDATPTVGGVKKGKSNRNHNRETSWGHQIRQLYRGKDGTVYAVAQGDNGLMWGVGYNPVSGVWQKSERNLSEAQIRSKAKGKTLILDNTGGH